MSLRLLKTNRTGLLSQRLVSLAWGRKSKPIREISPALSRGNPSSSVVLLAAKVLRTQKGQAPPCGRLQIQGGRHERTIKQVEDGFRDLKRIPEIIEFEWGTNNSPEGEIKAALMASSLRSEVSRTVTRTFLTRRIKSSANWLDLCWTMCS
jgi:hypothetical protein